MQPDLDRRLVAVMFTDMVGYTALIQADERIALAKRDQYVSAIESHHNSFGGTIIQRLGDGSMSMFPSALAAVRAATAMQRELAAHDVSVRIGIHVGEVIVEHERLTGDTVNIASRIESFAVPGGVMLSDAARDQLRNRGDVEAISLGRYKLKNVGRPMELFAIVADGIVVPDPLALEGKGERYASLPSNLPDPGSPLIGRTDELQALGELVRGARVVTVTGPGGVGKTRLIAELGRLLTPEFADGVAFVPLADSTDSAGFLSALAEALDVKEAEGRSPDQGVVSLLGDKSALLLLDNLEQIVQAAPEVARLAESCPRLRIVTSSRTPLRIAMEREYPLAPLALPDPGQDLDVSLAEYPAIALFVERARNVKPSFTLTPKNAGAVVAVCRRLDGLPLALELAAARLRILSPEALVERLDHALNVLTTGPHDIPARHQTLRAAIDWSHSLLSASEQRLFRRMAVFDGGCAFGDVEAVCAEPGEASLDELESLVDKALVQVDAQSDRLRLLQTIAEYARERLEASGEVETIRLRHAQRYATLAHAVRDGIEGDDQVGALERGITEEGNLQAALDTLLARTQGGDTGALELGMRMCGDLYLYWHIRGKNLTAREYATAFLTADASNAHTIARAGALRTAGVAWWVLGGFERAKDLWTESYQIAEDLHDERERCVTGFLLALGLLGFDLAAGLKVTEETITRSRSSGFAWTEGFALTVDGILRTVAGEMDAARASYDQALPILQQLGDHEGAGLTLGGLAALAAERGDLTESLDFYNQALAAFQTIGDRAEEARILAEMAWRYLELEDTMRARRYFLDSVRAYTEVVSTRGVGLSLIGLAATEFVENQPERAVQIAAAAEVYAHQEGIVNVYSEETPGREFVDRARAALSEADVARAEQVGRRLLVKQVLDLARSPVTPRR